MTRGVRASSAERAATRPGDDIVPAPDVVMDRGFDLPASPDRVWPWIIQLGKHRAGWYLPAALERVVPIRRRALRQIDRGLQDLRVGERIPDWGGRDEWFEVALVDPPNALVHRSRRGRTELSWSINLLPAGEGRTRMHLRLRLAPVRRRWLANSGGELVDALTVAGLAAGLSERLRAP